MDEAGLVDGRHRLAKLQSDLDGLGRAEGRGLPQSLLERAAMDELHPQPDLASDLLGSVDRDDVRMPDTGQETALVDDGVGG